MLKHPLLNLVRANAGRGQKFKVDPPKAAGSEAVFWFYDAIGVNPWDGSGVDPLAVAQALAGLGNAPVRFRIHSPGGDAFDGRAIASAIASYGGPTVAQIDGLAASAASYIALAADSVEMAPGSFFMIHEGWTFAMGNKGDMLQVASMLETFDNSIIADYARQTGNTPEQVTEWLETETWMEAADALTYGFADSILGEGDGSASALFDLSAYAKAPKALLERKPDPVVDADNARLQATIAEQLEQIAALTDQVSTLTAAADHAARARHAAAIARRPI
jgi:ATP-dependent protease ClpP protease subunit